MQWNIILALLWEIAIHQQNDFGPPGPPRGVMVLLVHPGVRWSSWSTFFEKLEKVWIRADQVGPGGPRGPRPPLVDQERSGPTWTTLQHFADVSCLQISYLS